ncbi:hypothetical protein IGI04_039923 [Brassica rapa subsp. trilocularis]|uniref:DUF223 domain-containing protein n=1 Tax=Brassica rapa subsp. trilocularis TaxID=1813537 RepID=A0ABQ7KMZ4_BRACM|nr:hypothetical protein IGI04_039923 [Brassica rapa subsp. trilocularis]
MEMTIYGNSDRFRSLEKQAGKWVEIFLFNLSATRNTQVHIIDPLNNQLFMDFKNIHAIPHMDHRDRNYLIDTMGVVFNTEAHFNDPASLGMVFYIRDYIDSLIKCVATSAHAYAFRDGLENMKGRGQVIVVLKMWRIILVILIYGLRPRVDYLTSGSIRVCRRLRSSGSLYYAVTLMFSDMGL